MLGLEARTLSQLHWPFPSLLAGRVKPWLHAKTLPVKTLNTARPGILLNSGVVSPSMQAADA